MNNVRRGSISVPAPVPPTREVKEEKAQGIKSLSAKLEDLVKKVESLESRKQCGCDNVEAKLSKEIKSVSKAVKDLIEN